MGPLEVIATSQMSAIHTFMKSASGWCCHASITHLAQIMDT